MAPILPSAQANKGDEYLRKARDLRDQWGQLIPGDDLTAVQNRITMSALFVSTPCHFVHFFHTQGNGFETWLGRKVWCFKDCPCTNASKIRSGNTAGYPGPFSLSARSTGIDWVI